MLSGAGGSWPLCARAQLEAMSASRRDGISAELERAVKWSAIKVIIDGGQKLHMDHMAVATACVFFHRYFARRSLAPHRNNVLVFAIACLYLAGKVEDSPKSVHEVLQWCLKKRYRFHPEIANQFSSQRDWYDKARERVFMAERALLYEMGFSFGVEHMYPVILGVLSEPRTPQDALDQPAGMAEARADLQPYTQAPALQSAIANLGFQMANESLKTTLCLQYTGVKIGAACTWLAIKMLQLDPLPEARAGWWARMGLSPEELDDIVSQLLEIYTPAAAEVVAGQADLMLTGIEVVGADAAAAAAAAQQQQAAAAAAAKQQQQQQQRQPPANGALAGGAAGGAGAGAAGEVAAGIEELDELEHFLSG